MSILQAIVLGIVQGITEFLPVSSSGHLIFIPKLFGWEYQGIAFDAVLHLATLLAVVFFFRTRVIHILKALFSRSTDIDTKLRSRFAILIALSILPAGIIGLFFGDWLDQSARSSQIVAFNMIGWAILLYAAEKYAQKKAKTVDSYHVSTGQMTAMALIQAAALIPGTSRSGSTMTAGMFAGLTKKAAAEISFLMSIPVIGVSGGLKFIEIFTKEQAVEVQLFPLFIGFIAAAISGLFAIWFLMRIIEKWSFTPFVIYRILIGILILIFLV